MSSRYLSVAIDHGSTNSAIAVMTPAGPKVIRHQGADETMPSTVYLSRSGRQFVGAPAVRATLLNPPDEGEGHGGYKLRIGQDDRFSFGAAGRVMSAQELGGIVIGELLNAYQEEHGKRPLAAVITIPAMFDQPACEGTRKAAELAGLRHAPLLMEPVAAALAYGLNAGGDRENWMVFDLGGGTFDVSLVMTRDGSVTVPEGGHAGDNNLGGRKFDRELMDYVLQELSRTHNLAGFSRSNPAYRAAWNKLLMATEAAKITLSRDERAVVLVEGVLCKDGDGKPVQVEVPVTRKQYEQMIGPDISRALDICEDLLRKNRLSNKKIARLILIGGPTKTPFIRAAVENRLKIPVDNTIDPMTAVVLGAAVYAATQEYDTGSVSDAADLSGWHVRVEAPRDSSQRAVPVTGLVQHDSRSVEGCSVEIVRKDGGWTSGRIPLDEDGDFDVDVHIVTQQKLDCSEFQTVVRDASGQEVARLDEPVIWYKLPKGESVLPNSYLIERTKNRTRVMIEGGTKLPCEKEDRFRTTRPIRRGNREDKLHIAVLEEIRGIFGSPDSDADCNLRIAEMVIEGSDSRITRDIPEGSDLEITLRVDTSRNVTVSVYIPAIDEEFSTTFNKLTYGVSLSEVKEQLARLQRRVQEIRAVQARHPIPQVEEGLGFLQERNEFSEIEKDVVRAGQGEIEAEDRALKRTRALATGVSQLWKAQRGPRIKDRIKEIEPLVKDKLVEDLNSIRQQFNDAQSSGRESDYEQVEDAMESMDFELRVLPLGILAVDIVAIGNAAKTGLMKDSDVRGEALPAYEEANNLFNTMHAKGKENLTDGDIRQLTRMHERLRECFLALDDYIRNMPKDNLPDPSAAGTQRPD